MVILYFLGGQDPFREDNVEVMQRAVTEAGGRPKVLALPWGLPKDRAEEKLAELSKAFGALGASEVRSAWPDEAEEELHRKVSSADLVYLSDGEGRTMQRSMRFSGVKKDLQGYEGVIVGDAMGGAIMCRHCLLPPDSYSSTYTMILGLNLVDFGVVPRYRMGLDQYVVESSAGRTVFGVPEGSALLYGAGMFSNHGKVFMYKNGKRTVLSEGRIPIPP
jgi:peptidase E